MRLMNRSVLGVLAPVLLAASCSGGKQQDRYDWHELEVMVTAYNSLAWQTEGNPAIAAWGDTLRPGMPVVAVSRDLIRMGLGRGTPLLIEGLPDTFIVMDKMNARFRRHIDIFMGDDLYSARQWGRCRLKISYGVLKATGGDSTLTQQ